MGFASLLPLMRSMSGRLDAWRRGAIMDAFAPSHFFSVALYPGVAEYNWIPLFARRFWSTLSSVLSPRLQARVLTVVSPAIHSEQSFRPNGFPAVYVRLENSNGRRPTGSHPPLYADRIVAMSNCDPAALPIPDKMPSVASISKTHPR